MARSLYSRAWTRTRRWWALMLALALVLSEFVVYGAGSQAAAGEIQGTVFEDVAGDLLAGSNPGIPGVTVRLYRDDGATPNVPDALDTAAGSTVTAADGSYVFIGLAAANYWVVVDSLTIGSTQDPAASLDKQWAEQTYGPAGAWCADGVGGTMQGRATAGACYGGRRVDPVPANPSSDVPGSWPNGPEHLALVDGGAGASGVDFGFSFNVVTTTRGGGSTDDGPGGKTVQGSLRQFISNAEVLKANVGTGFDGRNVMRFVPAEPTNASGGGGAWWAINVTSSFIETKDGGTTIDGRAYDLSDGVTVRDTNPGTLGAGGTVGVDQVPGPSVPRPELEIKDKRFVVDAPGFTIARIAKYDAEDIELKKNADGFTLEEAVLGIRADGSVPGAGLTSHYGIYAVDADTGTVRNSIVSYHDEYGVHATGAVGSWLIEGSEFRANGQTNTARDAITIRTSGGATVRENLIVDNRGFGVEMAESSGGNTLLNNTITGNGRGGAEIYAVRINGIGNLIDRNVIHTNVGAGVGVMKSSAGTTITRNSMYDNGELADEATTVWNQIGIDLVDNSDTEATGDTPYVDLNDDGDGDSGGNTMQNFAVIDTAELTLADVVLSGWAQAGATIEFFLADPEPETGPAPGFGEGKTFLYSGVEGSGDDTDPGTGSYGPGPVNGVVQGQETGVQRFEFTVPFSSLPVTLVHDDPLVATATKAGHTSEFSGIVQVFDLVALDVTKTSDRGGSVYPGEVITYTITVENESLGAMTQTGVDVTDPVPAGTTWVSTDIVLPQTSDARDNFDTVSYSNSDGTRPWAGPWTETGDDGTPGGGEIIIRDNDKLSGTQSVLDLSGPSRSVERPIDLSGVMSARIEFDYWVYHLHHELEEVYLDVWDGVAWTRLHTFTLIGPHSSYQQFSVDITPYANAATKIRLATGPGTTTSEGMFVENLRVIGSVAGPPTPGGPGPTLVSGEALYPGDFITITYKVLVDDPPTVGTVVNTAYASSNEQPFTTSDAASDTVLNRPPVLDPVGDRAVDELALLTFTASGSDPDLHTISFSLSGAPAGASIDPSTGEFTWTPTEAQGPGVYTFDVVLTDDGSPNLSDSETIDVTVNEINVAPLLDPIGDRSGDEETLITFTAAATDADLPANTLTFSLAGAPAGASIDPSTGVFIWTPTEGQGPGVYTFDVMVTDDGTPALSDFETIDVTVNDVNEPPVLDPVGDKSGTELTLITFTATASDSDIPANGLTFSLAGAPAGASIDPSTGVFSWTPTEAQGPGVYTFDVVVTDDGTPPLADSETIDVTVAEDNAPPVLDPVGDKSVDELALLTFTATASDADLPPQGLTFSLSGAPAGASIDPSTGEFTWTPTEAQGPGVYTFDVVVTDDGTPSLSDSESIDVTVNELNVAPVLDPIGDRSVDEQTLLTFTATASDVDLPPNTLTFSLSGAPAGASIDPSTGVFTWTPTEAQGPGAYTFDVVVTDDGTPALADSETIDVTVNEINRPPVLGSIGDRIVDEQTMLSFTASATDPDTPANGLTFSLVGAPAGASINPLTGLFEWTPTEAQGPGVYTFDVVVTDDGSPNLADSETIDVTVNEVNLDPVLTDPGAQVDDEGDTVSLAISATDADLPANTLTFSATGLPPGLAIDPGSGVISGTVGVSAVGTYSPDVTVDDGAGGSDVISFTWTIETGVYLVAIAGGGSGDNLLTRLDPDDGNPATNETDVGTGTGTLAIRASDLNPGSRTLYAADGARLGTLNLTTGVFTQIGLFGSGDGAFGNVTVDDVNAMTFDATTGYLYVVENRSGDTDLLFRIDPATGAVVAGHFGVGVDYVEIALVGARNEVTGLAVDPSTGTMYASIGDDAGATNQRLATVNKTTGATGSINDLLPYQMYGLAFDDAGKLFGVGYDKDFPADENVYEIDTATAVASNPVPVDNGSGYETLTFPLTQQPGVFGTVFVDEAGNGIPGAENIGDGANPFAPGAAVYLFDDTGTNPGEPDAGDVQIAGPVFTDALGHFGFVGVPDGTYFAVVDSTTVAPPSGYNAGFTIADVWAEQTFGSIGAVKFDGIAYSFTAAEGVLYGGKQPAVGDAVGADLTTAEHVVKAQVAGAAVTGVEFGFSFNVVTNVETTTAPPGGRTAQGSLDQFLRNANAVAGGNALRFVPAVAANASGGGGTWWRIDYGAEVDPLTGIGDAATVVDGTAYDASDGVTVVDTNSGYLGANAGGGLTAGTDDLALPQIAKPELEIKDGGVSIAVAGALVPHSAIVRDLSVWGSGTAILVGPGVIDDVVIERNVVGSPPGGFADPGGGGLWGISVDSTASAPASGGVIRNNLVGFVDNAGVLLDTASADWTVNGNEVTDTGNAPTLFDGVLLWGGAATITGNYIHANYAMGVDVFYLGGHTIVNNTITGNGLGGTQTAGIRVQSSGNTVLRNIITGNAGPGVIVAERVPDLANDNLITENSLSGNGSIGIDLVIPGGNTDAGDGVNPNDAATDPSTGNIGLDHPVLSGVELTGGNLTITGTTMTGTTLEVYIAAPDPTGYGEGQDHLATGFALLEGGPNDDDPAAGSFSFTFPAPAVGYGDVLTAVAFDATNNTSEFGPNANVNGAPTLDPVGDRAVDEQTLLTFTATASDPDPDTLTFSLSGAPAGAAIDPSSGAFTWTPTEAQGPGTYTFDVVVTDDGAPALSDSETIEVTVAEINLAPSATNPGNQTNDEGDVVSLTIAASDADDPANTLTFSATGLPPGLSINSATGEIAGTLSYTSAGTYSVEVTVADNGTPQLDDMVPFSWTVNEASAPLSITKTSSAGGSVLPGATITYTIVVTNDDSIAHDNVTVSDPVPSGAAYVAASSAVTAPVSTIDTHRDEFNAVSYAGSDGSQPWTGPWDEDGESGDPGGGDMRVVTDPSFPAFAFRKGGSPNLALQRGADLSSYSTATLSYDYRRENPSSSTAIRVEISTNGFAGPWSQIASIPGGTTDAVYQSASIDITGYRSATTAIRFRHTGNGLGPGRFIYIDDVTITGTSRTLTAGPGTDPPTVASGYTLLPGESMTVTFDVTVDDPPTVGSISNTASTTSDQNPAAVVDSTDDTIVNRAPVLDPVGDKSIDEQTLLTFTATGADPDAPFNDIVFSLSGAPAGASIDPSTGVFTWTPTEAQGPGVYTFDVVVTDDGSPNLSDAETIDVTVGEVNRPPVLGSVGDKSIDEQSMLSFVASATDPDNPANGLSYSLVGAPAGASINPLTGLFEWTPTEAQGPGVYTFDVVVTDDGSPNLADSETIDVTVNEVNIAPVLDPVGDQTVDEQTLLTFTATASDVDDPANTLSFSLVGAPPGAVIDPSSGVFTWTPAEAQGPAVYSFDVVVTDDGSPALNDSETITVTVNEVNRPPILGGEGDQTVDEQTLLSFTASAIDPDLPANGLTFSLSGAPAGASIDPSSGVFSWTPTEAQGPGVYTFDVVVTDDGIPPLNDFETINVTVNEVNVAPVLDPVGDQTVDEQTLLSFTATASDVDDPANILSFSLVGAPAGASIDPSSGVFSWTPAEAQGPAVYTFDVVVTDDGIPNLSDSETISVTVNEVNVAPVLTSPGDQSHSEGDAVSLFVPVTDADDPANAFFFSASGLPPGLSIDQATGEISGIVSYIAAAGSPYTVDVMVDDSGSPTLTDSVSFTWTVADTAVALGVSKVSDAAGPVLPGSTLTYTITITNDDSVVHDSILVDDPLPAGSAYVPASTTIDAPAAASVADLFGAVSYAGSDGTAAWAGPWTEGGDDGLPGSGDIFIVFVDGENRLNLTDDNNSIQRSVDLSGTTGATLSFDYRMWDLQDPHEWAVLEVAPDPSGPWTLLHTFTATTYETIWRSGSWDISLYAAAGTTIRLRTSTDPAMAGDDGMYIDDVVIDYWTSPGPVAGGAPPTLASGYSLPPGGVMTVTFQATTDDPPTTASIVNTASVTSTQQPTATPATVSDTVQNRPPVLDPVGDHPVDEETLLTFTAAAADPDEPFNALSFSLVGAPAGAAIDPSSGVFTWTPTESQGPGVYTFDVVVTDDGAPNLSDSETIDVTVNEVNRPPVLAPVGDRSVDEQTTLSFTATASDPDLPAETLTFSLVGAPAGASIDPSSGLFSWTPTEAQGPGIYAFDVVVTDDGAPNLSDTDSITVTVNEINLAPVLGFIGDRTVDEQTTLSFTATASDPDVPANTLSFSLVGAPAGASIDPVTGLFTWTPTEAQGPGVYTFDVVVTDDGAPNLSDSETIDVTVNEVNRSPVLGSVGDRSVDEQTMLSFVAAATDPDSPANTLTFSLAGAPAGSSINPVTGLFEWTPTESQGPGVYTFDVVVTDDGSPVLTDSETIDVTVNEVNIAPVLDPVGDRTVDEQTLLTFTATASDVDDPANTLVFSLSGAPGGASIDPSSGVFTWTPTESQGPGVYTFDVVVTDNGTPNLNDSETIDITVNEVNRPPVLGSIGDRSVDEQTLLSFVASATDPDSPANTLSFSLAGAPAGSSINPVTGLFEWTPTESQGPGVYTFDVVVTDDGAPNLSDSETIDVTVNEVNRPPVLAPVGDRSVDEQTTLTFVAGATDPDIPANGLTFSLSGAPAGASIDPGSGVFSWTPTESQGPGVYTFDVVVTDNGTPNLSDSETIDVTVNEVNRPPVLDPVGAASGDEQTLITFTATSTDPDLPANGATFSLSGAPAGASIDPGSGVFTWTPTESQGPGVYTFDVVVTDDGTPNLSDSETITVTVSEVNRPPSIVSPGSQTHAENQIVSLALTVVDPDVPANGFTWSATGLPLGLAIDPATGVVTGTVDYEAGAAAPYTVTVSVVDDGTPAAGGFVTFTWNVAETNRTPSLAPIADRADAEGDAVSFFVFGSDPDSADSLTYSATGLPPGITINPTTGAVTGAISYEASPGSPYSAAVTVTDSGSPNLGHTVSFTWTVADTNRVPVADGQTRATLDDTPTPITLTASDPDGDPLTFTVVDPPTIGTITGTAPELVYVAPFGAEGLDSLTFTVSDGKAVSAPAVVTIDVKIDNDPPDARADEYSLVEGTSLVVAAPGVMRNDSDPDGDALFVELVAGPAEGTLSLNADGSFRYQHDGGGSGSDSFTYRLTDDIASTAPVRVDLTINRHPVAQDDAVDVAEDTFVIIDLLGNDVDPDGDRITIRSFTSPSHGALEVLNGRIGFEPPPNWHGTTQFSYTIVDGRGGQAGAVVAITVVEVNDDPTVTGESAVLDDYVDIEFDVLANDFDIDGDEISLLSVGDPVHGSVRVVDGIVVYSPRVGHVGVDTFSYRVSDQRGGEVTGVVFVEVLSVALEKANRRFHDVGGGILNFESPAALPAITATVVRLTPSNGVRLLADAFFQSIDVLRLPLALLGIAMLWALALGGLLNLGGPSGILAMLIPSRRRRIWAVVLLNAEESLPVVDEPGGNLVHSFGPTARNIVSRGRPVRRDATTWMPVESPRGDGWVDASFLTEMVDSEHFIDDERIQELVDELELALIGERDLGQLVTSRGLYVAHSGPMKHFSKSDVSDLMTDETEHIWREGDSIYRSVVGTFRAAVARRLHTAVHSPDHAMSIDSPVLVSALIPTEFYNFHYVSVGLPGRMNSWTIHFEYSSGKPRIVALSVDG